MVDFTEETKQHLQEYIKKNNIPNPVDIDILHTTLLYTFSDLSGYVPITYDPPLIGTTTKFEKWPTQPKNGKISMCLVMRIDCPTLSIRYNDLIHQHNAAYTFAEYKPHITLSYDVNNFNTKDLPDFNHKIVITNEFKKGRKT